MPRMIDDDFNLTPFERGLINGMAFLPWDTPIKFLRQPIRFAVIVGGAYALTRGVMAIIA